MATNVGNKKNQQCQKCRTEPAAIAFCNTCQKHICQNCVDIHQLWMDYETHEVKIYEKSWPHLSPKKPAICTDHPQSVVTHYCDTCSRLVCTECDDDHSGHKIETIKAKCLTKMDEIDSALKKAKNAPGKQLTESISDTIATIKRQQAAIERKVEKEAGEVIEKKKCEYNEQARVLEQEKIAMLEEQKQLVQAVETNSIDLISYTEDILQSGNDAEIYANTEPILQAFKNIEIEQNQIHQSPEREANMIFLGSGSAFLSGAVVSLTCTINSDLRSATVGAQTTIRCTMSAMTSAGHPYSGDFGDLTAKLVNNENKAITECIVVKHQSEYEIKYQPAKRGRHELKIEMNEQEIQGSPFPITVQANISALESPVRVIDGVHDPWGITTNSTNHIVVVESAHNESANYLPKVVRYDTDGTKRTVGGPFGTAGQFTLRGVAVDDDDNVYVVVRSNKCNSIHKINSKDGSVQSVGGAGSSQFKRPVGIGFNKTDKRLYVCDKYTVLILEVNLSICGTIGFEGSENGQFQNCIDVAFDSAGKIYVTDYHKKSIQVFGPDKLFIREIKSERFEQPYGIAIDSCDHVYVTERDNAENCIHIFTKEGDHLKSFGRRSTEKKGGHFDYPWGIHIDQDNLVLVSDKENHRIQIF